MNRLTRDGTAEPVSRDQILRHARGQGNVHFPCSADHEQDWQLYPVDPYSAICDDHNVHTYIHTYHTWSKYVVLYRLILVALCFPERSCLPSRAFLLVSFRIYRPLCELSRPMYSSSICMCVVYSEHVSPDRWLIWRRPACCLPAAGTVHSQPFYVLLFRSPPQVLAAIIVDGYSHVFTDGIGYVFTLGVPLVCCF